MDLLLLLGASYGVCFGLMNDKVPGLSQLLQRLPVDPSGGNFFTRLLECAYCTGFHSGWLTATGYLLAGGELPGTGFWGFRVGLCALASSAFCYSVDSLLQFVELQDIP